MLQKKPNQKETDAMIVQEAKQMCSSNVQHGVSRRDFNILDFGAIFLSNRTPQEECLRRNSLAFPLS